MMSTLILVIRDPIKSSIHLMIQYFESMVDPKDHRFFLVSRPHSGEYLHSNCQLRALGCTWDATTALTFLLKQEIDWQLDTVQLWGIALVNSMIQSYRR